MQDVNDQNERHNVRLARQTRALEECSCGMQPLASISKLCWIVAIAVAAGLVVATFGQLLMIIFAAVLIATLLRGAGLRIGTWTRIGPGWGMLVVILTVLVLAVCVGWWRGADLIDQASKLQQLLVLQFGKLQDQLQQSAWGRGILHNLPLGLGRNGSEHNPGSSQAGSLLPRLGGFVFGAVWSALGLLGMLAIILVTAIYFGASPQTYVNGLVSLAPKSRRALARRLLNQVGDSLWGWLVGQFLDMLVVGILIGIGLALLGVPLAFILAITAALLNFVPYIGAIAGAVPSILIALSVNEHMALYVALLFLGVQTFEGNVSAPLIQKRTIDLPPAVSILSQTAMGAVFGLFGVVLATPFAAAVITTVQALQEERAGAWHGSEPDGETGP